MSTDLILKSWGCPNCPYYQQFDPTDASLVMVHFPECPDLPLGKCPACWMGKNPQRVKQDSEMGLIINPSESRLESRVTSDTDLEESQVPEEDEHGNVVMEPSGEVRYRFDPMTGTISPVDVMRPKMRSLTPQELAEKMEQRDRNLDALEGIAI